MKAGHYWREDLPLSTSPMRLITFASKPHVRLASLSLACVVFAAALQNSIPLLMKQIVNAATALQTGGSVWVLSANVAGYVVASLVAELIWRLSGFIGNRWALGARSTARYALSSYVTLHSRSYFASRYAGTIGNNIAHASNVMRDIIGQLLWELLPFAVAVIAACAVAATTSPVIAWIFVGWVAVAAPLNIFFSRKRIGLSSMAQRVETNLNGGTLDLLSNLGTMQEYVRRPFEMRRLQDMIVRRQEVGLRTMDFGEWMLTANSIIQAFFVTTILAYAIMQAQAGQFSAGDFVLIVSVVFSIQGRLLFLGQSLETFGERMGEIQHCLEEIIEPFEITDAHEAKPLKIRTGAIVFDNAAFGYADRGVLQGLSLYIPGRQKVGLVGKSGAGKSTIVKLLLRHYELSGGEMLIDGQNIAHITRDSLRHAIAVVPQEPLLFSRSVFENIAYGRPDATKDEVMRAAELANADQFIRRLPEGYDTLVGERAARLSGGERQRVAIARAVLKNAPILILDEATSALDSESEHLIQKALERLMEGKTVIAIAHRLSTLREMDRIIVLDQGIVSEDGTHEGLMKASGTYSQLWQCQVGGFMVEV